jgi:hypothetical protein
MARKIDRGDGAEGIRAIAVSFSSISGCTIRGRWMGEGNRRPDES